MRSLEEIQCRWTGKLEEGQSLTFGGFPFPARRAIFIGRDHPDLNYGQTGHFTHNDRIIGDFVYCNFYPDGDTKTYIVKDSDLSIISNVYRPPNKEETHLKLLKLAAEIINKWEEYEGCIPVGMKIKYGEWHQAIREIGISKS